VRIGRYHLEVWDRVPSAGLCVTSAAGSVEGSWKDGAQVIPLFRVPAIDAAAAAERIRDVLASGYTGEGARCLEFEEALARELRMRVLYVNSCTSALRLAYHLAGARREKEVISTPVTSLATNTAIIETGARIVWADVDPVTGNIDPDDVLRKVSPRTVAVAAVDWGGRLCAYDRLRAGLRGPAIVEDAAHAFGADRGPGPVSERRGDFVCFSFQSIKHVSTADGGALACPSDALRERARLLRWFGLDRSRGSSMRCYQSVSEAGFKMQGNDVLATLGIEGLRGAPTVLARCRANATSRSRCFVVVLRHSCIAADPVCCVHGRARRRSGASQCALRFTALLRRCGIGAATRRRRLLCTSSQFAVRSARDTGGSGGGCTRRRGVVGPGGGTLVACLR
jgi:dTDP-4-amino-4,6-dideoxygalactose transaminase